MGARKYSYDTDQDITGCLHDQTRVSNLKIVRGGHDSRPSNLPDDPRPRTSGPPVPTQSGVVPINRGGPPRTSVPIPPAAGLPIFAAGVLRASPETAVPRWAVPSAPLLLASAVFLVMVVIAASVHYG